MSEEQINATNTKATVDPKTTPIDPNVVAFDISFRDFRGKPIVGLAHKIKIKEDGQWIEMPGQSDAQGAGIHMSGMESNTPLEIWVRKDNGEYSRKYSGTVGCSDTRICAISPHIVIPLKTEVHKGEPGTAPEKPKGSDVALEKKPNAPLKGNTASDGKHADITPTVGRDKQGNPIATLTDPSKDCNDRHRLPIFGLWTWNDFSPGAKGCTTPAKTPPLPVDVGSGAAPVVSIDGAPPEVVTNLIKIMEEQVTWAWKDDVMKRYPITANIIAAVNGKTWVAPQSKSASQIDGRCYPSVKTGLWRAHMVEGIDESVHPATEAGGWLTKQGFKNIIKELPDARWAAPGDVIVYQYDDVTIAALKKSNSQIYGHIDVRTYDGYLSDFKSKENILPNPLLHGKQKGFVVNGIYRKDRMFDPLPDLRVRAFLKVLREWECHEEQDDAKRYFILQNKIDGNKYFTNTSTHPYADQPNKNDGSFSGAYQMRYVTWKELIDKFGMPVGFSPEMQDRYAVAKIEGRGGLGLIREGKIREAIPKLSAEWSSLAGGRHARQGKTLEDVVSRYNQNLKELVKK